jgi:hypothetical protein
VIRVSPTNRTTRFAFGSAIAIAIPLPHIRHVDDDHQLLAAVTRVDSPKITQRELAAADPIDVAVLDISLGSESRPELLSIIHNRDAIPVTAFSVNVETQACDEGINAILARSCTSLENLPATMRDRLVLPPATPIEEIA